MASARSRSAGLSLPRYWGRGIATRLGQHALVEVGTLGLRSIIAYAREDNLASRAVMTKLGLTYEKSFVDDGEPTVLYRKPVAEA